MKKRIYKILLFILICLSVFVMCSCGGSESYYNGSTNNGTNNSSSGSNSSGSKQSVNITTSNIKSYYSFKSTLENASINKATYQVTGNRILSYYTGSVNVRIKVVLTFKYKINMQSVGTSKKTVTDYVNFNSSLSYLTTRKTVYSYLYNYYIVDVTMDSSIISASGTLYYSK